MTRYLIRRLLLLLPVLLGVTVMSYFIITLAPGDPVDLLIDPNMTAADKEIKRHALGLDQPVIVQYGQWLWQLLHGNLGYSFATYQSVGLRIAERIGPTLLLSGTALLIAYLLAIPLGIVSARRQYSWVDYGATVFALLGVSLPSFFVGLLGIWLFSLRLNWLPTGNMITVPGGGGVVDVVTHLVMPAAVLSLATLGSEIRYVRSSMLDVIQQDYIRTARAKGLAEQTITYRHALRNALIPVITLAGLQLPFLLGGAVVTEQVFRWPGMGLLTIEAINSRDYPTLMGINLIAAIMVMLGNLLADIAYSLADPRIRYD
mgnify:CR=1 FL=1